MAISILVEALLPGSGGATTQSKGGGNGKPENVKEWLRNKFNPSGTKSFGTYTKNQERGGGRSKSTTTSISRRTNAANLKTLEVLGVSFKVSEDSS